MIFFGIALLVCHALAAPTTESPHAAIEQLNAVISKEVEKLWHNVDTNNDTLFGRSDMDIIFVNYDHNKDNNITKAEFISQFTHNSPGLNPIANGLFLEFDMNHDDTITHQDIDKYYMKLDTNDDGNVSKDEFKDYFTKVLTLLFIIQIQHENHVTTPAAVIG